MNAPQRTPATPYARRLARERGLPLAEIGGSGPHGRITAADILAFVPKPAPPIAAEAPAPAPPVAPVIVAPRAVGAFQASADLAALSALIAASGADLSADPFLAKAAARAAGSHGRALLLRDRSGRGGVIEDAAGLSPGAIVARHAEGTEADAAMIVEIVRAAGIRPVGASLPPPAALRLIAVLDGTWADLLLVHDEDAIPSAEAAAMLTEIRALAEAPLRLLV
jgi:pyruvate dehydrogenase E2 component (dihydrolipoamide acetyltransferase)